MAERSELWIVALVVCAAGLVLAAPVLGRLGYDGAADAVMALAAAGGLGSFAIAGRATVRAIRLERRARRGAGDAR